jgi:hypothetical protein
VDNRPRLGVMRFPPQHPITFHFELLIIIIIIQFQITKVAPTIKFPQVPEIVNQELWVNRTE